MKALTLHRPWPWCIFHWPAGVAPGPKWIENRTWAPPRSVIGQVIAIHAGKTFDVEGAAFVRRLGVDVPAPALHPLGVVGTARVTGFVDERALASVGDTSLGRTSGLAGVLSPWFFGPYGWVLDEVRALAAPIPCRGAQGLWTVDPEIALVLEAQR